MNIENLIIETYKAEKGDNFRMEYVENYIIPNVKKLINREIKNLDELKISGYLPIYDTRNNFIVKKILENILNIKLSGTVKKDKLILQSYLNSQ